MKIDPVVKVNILIEVIKKITCQSTTTVEPQDQLTYDAKLSLNNIMNCFDLCGQFYDRQQSLQSEMRDLQIAKRIAMQEFKQFESDFDSQQESKF